MNSSGIFPIEEKVLVKPLKSERVTQGGIVIPESEANKQDMAQVKAEVVAVGTRAFEYTYEFARRYDLSYRIPKPGDCVAMARYAGYVIKGSDGESYRIINDQDITAILEESNG